MQCGCGGNVSERNHTIKTLKGATDWLSDVPIDICFPLNIEQHECKGCGRSGFIVRDGMGEILNRRGV
jgi:hypothetical protein